VQEKNAVVPYLDGMLASIGKIFEWGVTNNNFVMMDAVLGTLCTIASIASFEKYYGSFMPGLKKLVAMVAAENTQQSLLRNKTV
jgi:asparagine N-glycosylation enzyme membrane subunit Stt3